MKKQQPRDKKRRAFKRASDFAIGGLAGGFLGGIAYGVSHIFTDEEHAQRWGIGVGAFFAVGGTGTSLANRSLEEAEDYAAEGQRMRSRLKVAQATLEGVAGFGAAGGIVGFETGGTRGAMIGTGIGATLGGFATLSSYEERRRKLPELIIPSGSSIERDTRFAERKDGHVYPPVYRVSSLKDLKEFREVNKEKLAKTADSVPAISDKPYSSISGVRFLTAVMIIPDLQHYPLLDPDDKEKSLGVGAVTLVSKNVDMKLHGEDDNIVVHPYERSFLFWQYPTIFDDVLPGQSSGVFSDKKWAYWQEKSWKHPVIVLA